ncbi:MAG: hypothetical protein ACI4E1_10140 [Lachnospira sp.]
MKLNDNKIIFVEDTHQYFINEKELKGVTGILTRRLFPDKYKYVVKEVLDNSANRGKYIHRMCELVDDLCIEPESIEAKNYIIIKEKYNLKPVAREYLITDGEHYASAIDAVYEVDGGVVLNDLKTTYKLDKEYISWQLSIYKYFFELNNPDIEVKGLTATWLKGDIAEYVEIKEKSREQVLELLRCDINDEEFKVEYSTPEFIRSRVEALVLLKSRINELQSQFDALKSEVEDGMRSGNYDTIKTDSITFSLTKDSTTKSFDSKKFKKENSDLYNNYLTEKTKKGYLTLRFN